MNKLKVNFLLGTKAQFIKSIPVINEAIKSGCDVILYDLNQHAKTTKYLLGKINTNLTYISLTKNEDDLGTYFDLIKWFSNIISKFVIFKKIKFNDEICIVHGDTLSTLLGVLIVKRGKGKLVLLEAGHAVPGIFKHFPESIIRITAAKLSRLLITNGQDQVEQLKKWGVKGDIFEISTNSILDSFKEVNLLDDKVSNKVTVAIHRNENLNNKRKMKLLTETIINISKDFDITWYLHIPTKNKLKKYNLYNKLSNSNIKLTELIPYDHFINELHNSEFVITDGGSLVEECQLLGVPTLVWREEHLDQNHLFTQGPNLFLSMYSTDKINYFLSNYKNLRRKISLNNALSPSKEIINSLNEFMKLKVVYVLGTKAQFIKCKHILENLVLNNINIVILDTGQHKNLTNKELQESGLAYEYLNISNNKSNVSTISEMFVWFFKIVFTIKNKRNLGNVRFCLVHGDTISTLIGLIYGKVHNYKTVHLESGYKSFNILKPFPEEIIRNIVTKFSDLLVVDGKTQLQNVKKYQNKKNIIEISRNTIVDSLIELKNNFPIDLKNNLTVTVHRTENIYSKKKLLLLINLLRELQHKYNFDYINWFCHDVTLNAINKYKLQKLLQKNNIIIKNLETHSIFLNELICSRLVITDGGSIAEECSLLGINTVIWRDLVENESYLNNHVILSKYSFETIFTFIDNMNNIIPSLNIESSPSKELVKKLIQYIN